MYLLISTISIILALISLISFVFYIGYKIGNTKGRNEILKENIVRAKYIKNKDIDHIIYTMEDGSIY